MSIAPEMPYSLYNYMYNAIHYSIQQTGEYMYVLLQQNR